MRTAHSNKLISKIAISFSKKNAADISNDEDVTVVVV